MAEELLCQASPRLDEEIQVLLRLLRLRYHHEGMTLQEGPEAAGRDPKINRLPGLDFESLLKLYADSHSTIFIGNVGSSATVGEDTVLADDRIPLHGAHECPQPC